MRDYKFFIVKGVGVFDIILGLVAVIVGLWLTFSGTEGFDIMDPDAIMNLIMSAAGVILLAIGSGIVIIGFLVVGDSKGGYMVSMAFYVIATVINLYLLTQYSFGMMELAIVTIALIVAHGLGYSYFKEKQMGGPRPKDDDIPYMEGQIIPPM